MVGGELDGVPYFEIEKKGEVYWLTDVGLFSPPQDERSASGSG